MLGGRLYE